MSTGKPLKLRVGVGLLTAFFLCFPSLMLDKTLDHTAFLKSLFQLLGTKSMNYARYILSFQKDIFKI